MAASPISDADFKAKVLESPLPVLLDFWAPWCGPCKAMNPILEELAALYAGKIEFYKMNVDENMETPQQFNVLSIPTFVLFKNGKAVDSIIGAKSKEEMSQHLDSLLK